MRQRSILSLGLPLTIALGLAVPIFADDQKGMAGDFYNAHDPEDRRQTRGWVSV